MAIRPHIGSRYDLNTIFVFDDEINSEISQGRRPETKMENIDGPLIGITGRKTQVDGKEAIFWFKGHYDGVVQAGAKPYLIIQSASSATVDEIADFAINNLEGIVFTGGIDTNPAYYGQQRVLPSENLPGTDEPYFAKDLTEKTLFGVANKHNISHLAVCAGFQRLNVFRGGSLYQEIKTMVGEHHDHNIKNNRNLPVHKLITEPETVLRELYGAEIEVNSTHHQAVRSIGNGLRLSATSDDGLIEGVQSNFDKPGYNGPMILGLQFHPEAMLKENPIHLRPYQWLVDNAKR